MYPGQGGPNRPPWQQGQSFNGGGGRGNGPPPAKRSRSGPGPVITRYPPPPGYTGPARPPRQFQQPGWPQPHAQPSQHYAYGQAPSPGFQNPGYRPPQLHHQQSYPGAYTAPQPPSAAMNPYNQQINSSTYAPPQSASGHAGYNHMAQQWTGGAQQYPPNSQQYNATGHQYSASANYNNSAHHRNMSLQSNASAPQYGSSHSQNGGSHQRSGSVHTPATASNTAFQPPAPPSKVEPTPPFWQPQNQISGNVASSSQQMPYQPGQQQNLSTALQPRHNSAPSIPNVAHFNIPLDYNNNIDDSPASETGYLSKEADELEAAYYGAECPYARCQEEIDPTLSLGEVVYRPALPTRRPLPATAALAELDAIAPRVEKPTDLESISEYFINSKVESNMLDVRQTDQWETVKNDLIFRSFSAVPVSCITPDKMQAKWRDRPDPNWTERVESPTPEPEPAKPSNIKQEPDALSDLEKVLESSSSSFGNQNTNSTDRPRALGGVARDQTQEDVLASLGVTGSPKMVYQTPGPAYSRNNSISSNQGGRRGSHSYPPPPPPPPPGYPPNGQHRRPSRGEWSHIDRAGSTALHSHNRRSASTSSNHTAAGSDFGSESGRIRPGPAMNGTSGLEDPDRTPRAALQSENRKRAFEDGDEDGMAGGSGSENGTPRPSHKAARMSR